MISEFLKRLAEVAPLYKWKVTPWSALRGERKEVKCPDDFADVCPITAVAGEKLDTPLTVYQFNQPEVYGAAGLDNRDQAQDVMMSADRNVPASFPNLGELRKQIMVAVGLDPALWMNKE